VPGARPTRTGAIPDRVRRRPAAAAGLERSARYARLRGGVTLSDVDGKIEATWEEKLRDEPGRIEGVAVSVPAGVSLAAMPERTLNELRLAGEIDAVIAAHPPEEFKRGGGHIVRLFSDHRAVGER
jgi:hypothetical protein